MLIEPIALQRRHGISRTARPLGLALAAVSVAALLAAGAQEIARVTKRSALLADETFVDVGGRDLRLVCSGAGDTTFVLEAGATGFAETWTWTQDALDDEARVCSYDRAGMGLSAPAPSAFDPAGVAEDLHTALVATGETGPFVLAGHSLGGFFVRDFAARFPEDTAALILVDASHEDQLEHLPPEIAEGTRTLATLLRALSHASKLGLLNLWSPIAAGAEGLEGDALAAAEVFAGDRRHLAASADEMAHWDAITDRLRDRPLARALPVLAVTAESGVPGQPDFSDAFASLHRDLASRSDEGKHAVIAEANHFSILMHREHGEELARLIEGFVDRTLD